MVEELGPTHMVRIAETGASELARLKTTVNYDQGWAESGVVGLKPHLPTLQTTSASSPESGVEKDKRITETKYDWNLRKPTETIVDPGSGSGHLDIRSVTVYEKGTGLPVEQLQPKAAASAEPTKNPGTTKILYYGPSAAAPCKSSAYAGLLCETLPAGQVNGTGRSKLLVKRIASYNALSEPTKVIESPEGGAANERKTIIFYDPAGRLHTQQIQGGGTATPTTETVYSSTLGMPIEQRFVCGTECTNTRATKVGYDELGRQKEYEDADGNKSKTTYDVDGRPVTTSDNKGSQTITYDPTSGLPTKLEDSAAGTFTATYDADGNMKSRVLPDGLTATTTYNAVDEPISLSYTKETNCGTSCTWLSESLERSVYGQILTNNGTLVNDSYSYDKDGRLTEARETPAGGSCTTRAYTYDLDSNRLSMATRAPVGGVCVTSGGAEQKYSYDEADRLINPTYDAWGRITKLPAEFAGGKELTTSYYNTSMVATQTQNGITNSYELDSTGRQRARLQGGGGLEGTEIFHYDGPSDSVAWTERGSTWTRSIGGIGGELAAIQEGSASPVLQLTSLHGHVVATAELSPTVTKLNATFRFDEFGNPVSGIAGRYGWLGGKSRRTELPSGVIQMGVRSYVPGVGRFLSPDPVPGGSANAYDYAIADPVNGLDLGGEHTCNCGGHAPSRKVRQRRVRRAVRNANLHRILPTVICGHCSEHQPGVVEEAAGVVSSWTAPARHWTAEEATELAGTVSGAVASIPCRQIGIALDGSGASISSAGLATVWIPDVGEVLLLIGGGVDLAGVSFDLMNEKGVC